MNRAPVLFALLLVPAVILAAPSSALAGETVNLDRINRIRDEGFHHSQVMEIAHQLTDVIGGRVTGSPAMLRANEWTRDQLKEWGLENAHLEGWKFGRGWDWQSCRVDLLGPAARSLSAIPQAWTPGTDGPVRGEVVLLTATEAEGLEEFRGKLEGKIVLLKDAVKIPPREAIAFERYSAEELEEIGDFEIPEEEGAEGWRAKYRKRVRFLMELDEFLADEGVLASIEPSSRSHGILRVMRGGMPDDASPRHTPMLIMMTEQYNRLVRLAEDEEPVELELDIRARFHGDRDSQAFNTLAEIPGGRLKSEVVMLGAHLDSWHGGTGATDNAAGSIVVMEALRILEAIGARPARTIRIGLWSGEEQGLLGSSAWVDQHLASRPAVTDSAELALPRILRAKNEGELSFHPEYKRISAYFNIDNGSGRLRGIYTQENVAVVPIFREWLAPFEDLGVDQISTNNTGGTDHLSFDRVGIPGFQFIQDKLDYFTQTHHTHLDTRDHLQREDLMQAAVIVASVVLEAADREGLLPRKPLAAD